MQLEDFEWFIENYDKLYKEYGKSFIAIKNKTVLGIYNSYGDGVRATKVTHQIGTFIVQECNGDESGYTNCIASMFI